MGPVGTCLVIPTPPDPFDEWLAVPIGAESNDPRFEVRRVRPEEFDRIYDCVDAAFGKKRPRKLYDWLYRANPYGLARVWITAEKESGRVLKTGGYFPWPIWCGDEARRGSLAGDAGTVPDWQRKGLSADRRRVRKSHPWHRSIVTIAGPNEGSRVVNIKAGEGSSILGPLRGGVAVLRARPLLERGGLPSWLAEPLGAITTPIFSSWTRLGARSHSAIRFQPLSRFETAFDEITLRTMGFPMYWCPHNADWLNWRYLDHPVEPYQAFALVEDDRPIGYSVLRLAGDEATLSEFAVAPDRAAALMAGCLDVARAAGCAWVNFFAPPRWRHWRTFRRAGFLPYTSKNYLDAKDWADVAGSERMDAWQVTPGDRDFH